MKEKTEDKKIEEEIETPKTNVENVGETKEKIEEKKEEKREKKEEHAGIAYISSSPNNTLVHITDLAGNTISRVSGGMITKHSRLKSNPTIAIFVAKKAAERALDLGLTRLYVRIKGQTNKGTGPGAHAAVKSLSKSGFIIISILDTTKVPRGGPKKKGGKRGRRV